MSIVVRARLRRLLHRPWHSQVTVGDVAPYAGDTAPPDTLSQPPTEVMIPWGGDRISREYARNLLALHPSRHTLEALRDLLVEDGESTELLTEVQRRIDALDV